MRSKRWHARIDPAQGVAPVIARSAWTLAGWTALVLGFVGIVVPLLPTVPFVLLAAFCFARGNPRLEAWLVGHPRFGHHIRDWRASGAIARRGKVAATLAFAFAIAMALLLSPWPWPLVPMGVAVLCLAWLWTRPEP